MTVCNKETQQHFQLDRVSLWTGILSVNRQIWPQTKARAQEQTEVNNSNKQ